jgi:hypothetical protein
LKVIQKYPKKKTAIKLPILGLKMNRTICKSSPEENKKYKKGRMKGSNFPTEGKTHPLF